MAHTVIFLTDMRSTNLQQYQLVITHIDAYLVLCAPQSFAKNSGKATLATL